MKVVSQTPDELILESRPWITSLLIVAFIVLFFGIGLSTLLSGDIGGLLFLLGAIVVGGGAFWAFVRFETVRLSRPLDRVDLVSRSILGVTRKDWALSDVARAATERQRSARGTGSTRRPVLIFRGGGSAPIGIVYTNGRGPGRAAKAINDWLGVEE